MVNVHTTPQQHLPKRDALYFAVDFECDSFDHDEQSRVERIFWATSHDASDCVSTELPLYYDCHELCLPDAGQLRGALSDAYDDSLVEPPAPVGSGHPLRPGRR